MKKTNAPPSELTGYFTEEELRKQADFEWVDGNHKLRRKHGGKIAVVYNKTLIAVGTNHATAWAAAQQESNCPTRREVAMVYIHYLVSAADAKEK